ncbi:MAG: hypothetical protein FWC73_04105 [Defluviitaleaceae bacterium]|nr:hypothetical protein [Defluviitaleaceae bacterium]
MRRPISWFWVVLALILFWPVGLILLFKRLSTDRTATFSCGKRLNVVAVVLFIIGGVLIISPGSGGAVIGVMFIVGGLVVLRSARKNTVQGNRYRQYVDLIVNHNQRSVPHIAAIMGLSNEMVMLDLHRMINEGFFVGARIDRATNEIVLMPHPSAMPHGAPMAAMGMPAAAPPRERIVVCDGCGANNKVFGPTGTCEYCGSPLQ